MLICGGIVAAGLAFVSRVHTVRCRWWPWAVLAIVGAVFGFALKGAALTGTVDGAWNTEMLALLWSTQQGTALALHLGGAAILLMAAMTSKGDLAVAGGVLFLAGFVVTGHVADQEQFLLQAILILHLVIASYWIGILGPLIRLSQTDAAHASRLGEAFGRTALAAIPVLLLAGGVLAVMLLDSVNQLFSTEYGRVLLLKLLAVSGMLLLGALNKLRHVPALVATGDGRALARSVRLEAVVAGIVLLATASFSTWAGLP